MPGELLKIVKIMPKNIRHMIEKEIISVYQEERNTWGWIEISTAIGCINKCKYCPQKLLISNYLDKSKTKERLLSYDLYKIILEKIPVRVKIDFSGMAEPFQNRDCSKMIEYAYKKGHQISVYTTLKNLSIEDIIL